ncbi:molybdenum cofactor guanylyltransferase MobA [Mammaliicoccus stepanovicii]|uniref:Probable molybdenum cofactor guanylyltransferase n=1 Tax=Mammaliicoccus stepanovicii TaxID=643214 RepID=A0A239YI59_9STAP|nr:molybdenum cofactor guanylyltransferase MobA [Mammaliicoccus stepanovicii]PNZ77898.1 molybdenum cofactor guanylyltransferase MobA [Mammaliicoccus stepanovicii]GGI40969.1 putative molybdenum cofactor guanylyltransferase [Mammaliicoccus stepanovicii]SNV58961.1 molybdopterin-guanine dinucleotide biosynthesis protein MobA [Mammaliicoccus stepanovicii]
MIAIILAGGASSRFGSPKAFASINGEVFYKKIKKTLNQTNLFEKIVISSSESLQYSFDKDDQVVVDLADYKNNGPLGGIYSVMHAYESECYFVIACDTPKITEKAISHLYQFYISRVMEEQLEIAGYEAQNHKMPTLAFYSYHVKEDIKQALDNKHYRMSEIYQNKPAQWLNVDVVNDQSNWFQNINYVEDLKNE